MKPTLFIASSSEGLTIAQRFAEVLSDVTQPVLWDAAPEFVVMRSTLDGLIASAERYDFGLFIFTPDDAMTSRGETSLAARDNVILELGLFLGQLGRDRAFAVVADGEDPQSKVKTISDLFGIKLPRFYLGSPKQLMKSVESAAEQLRLQIRSAGYRRLEVPLLRKWNFKHQKATFSATLGGVYLQRAEKLLFDNDIVIVCRREDKSVNFDIDKRLAFSEQRAPILTGTDMVFKLNDPDVFGRLDEDDVVECYVVLTPRDFVWSKGMTLASLRDAGCKIVDGGAKSEIGSARRL